MTKLNCDLLEKLESGIYEDPERKAYILVPELAVGRVIQQLAMDCHDIATLLAANTGLQEKGSYSEAMDVLAKRQEIRDRFEADFAMQQLLGKSTQHIAIDHAGGGSVDIRKKLLGIK